MGRRCGEMERRGRVALLLLAAGGAAGGSGRGTHPGSPGSSGAAHLVRAARGPPAPEPRSVPAACCPLPRRSPPCPAGSRCGGSAQPAGPGRCRFPGAVCAQPRPALRSRGSRCVPPRLAGSLPPASFFLEPDRLSRFCSGLPTSRTNFLTALS